MKLNEVAQLQQLASQYSKYKEFLSSISNVDAARVSIIIKTASGYERMLKMIDSDVVLTREVKAAALRAQDEVAAKLMLLGVELDK